MTKVFFDTNIFVYTLDQRVAGKHATAVALLKVVVADRTLVTSYQVIQEFLNLATSKFRTQLTLNEARAYAKTILWPWCEIGPSAALYHAALEIHETAGWTFYDSLIVGAAIEAGCSVLYSEDLQDRRRIHGLQIRNPFA